VPVDILHHAKAGRRRGWALGSGDNGVKPDGGNGGNARHSGRSPDAVHHRSHGDLCDCGRAKAFFLESHSDGACRWRSGACEGTDGVSADSSDRRNDVVWQERGSTVSVLAVVITIGVGMFLAWTIPADNASDGVFLKKFFGREIMHRATSPMEGHGGDFLKYLFYYIPVIIGGFFPWTLHLPGAISSVIGGRSGDGRMRAVFLGWTVPVVVLMSLAATKLPHYIVFIWPAMATGVGATLLAAREGRLDDRDRKWLRSGVWFFGPVAFGMAAAMIVGPWFVDVRPLRFAGGMCGVILLVMSIVAVRLQLRERFETSAKVLLIGTTAFVAACALLLIPAIETVKISPRLSKVICEKTTHDVPVVAYRFHEPSMFHYVGRRIEKISESGISAWAQKHEPGVMVISKADLEAAEAKYGPLGLETIADVKGFNYSKGKWTEIVALVRVQQ
jgi:4-amino-4-deoxy-L-arabinose transferase-like glycosyltransferase